MTEQPYQFGNEQDLRNVIQLLVDAHKLWQSRAVTANKTLHAIMAMNPKKRANLTEQDIHAIASRVQPIAEADAQMKAEQVEKKLKSGDFLNAVRVYASQQFWK